MDRNWGYLAALIIAAVPQSGIAADHCLIPKAATVILFPSLAGDVESERNHSGQLQSLLQLAHQSRAERVLLFYEGPVTSPQGLNVQQIKPSRAAFLGATTELPKSTNPASAFIWGHGGMQGLTPVFHVRGPRLTPADFKPFADKLTSGPSTWVLMFRGSGRFAAELASDQRYILASEGQSMFRNDPIGMIVLLNIWRGKPDFTCRELIQSFGPAVARWFDEQNLARTEEPTLWAGAEPARALLAPANASSEPVVPISKPQSPEDHDPN